MLTHAQTFDRCIPYVPMPRARVALPVPPDKGNAGSGNEIDCWLVGPTILGGNSDLLCSRGRRHFKTSSTGDENATELIHRARILQIKTTAPKQL